MTGRIFMQKDVAANRLGKAHSALSKIARQGTNYSNLVWWLVSSALRGRTTRLVGTIALSLIHLAAQAGAIYAVYWYGRTMEQTGPARVPWLDIQINLKDQPEWLWVVVIISTICFVTSASFLYLARRQILNLVEVYYARKVEELVLDSLRLPDPRARLATDLFMNFGVGGLTTGCRRAAIIVISFVNSITAMVGAVGATFFLLRIDLSLTLIILIAVSLAALLLYPLTLRAVRGAKDREKSQAEFKVELRQLVEERTVKQTVKSLRSADALASGYMMRRRVLIELVYAIEIGVTVILGLVIYYMASQALAGREQWAIFIAYIAALRMTLNGAAHAIQTFASVSRYYPQIVRYYLFTKDMQRIDDVPFAEVKQGDRVILGTLPNGEDIVAEAGSHIALVTIDPVRDAQYALIDARLPHSRAPIASAVLEPVTIQEGGPALALISQFSIDGKQDVFAAALAPGPLRDKVTLIVYAQPEKAGLFGETLVLTEDEGEFKRFAVLGTEEGEAALKEVALKLSAQRRKKRGIADPDDEDQDEDEN